MQSEYRLLENTTSPETVRAPGCLGIQHGLMLCFKNKAQPTSLKRDSNASLIAGGIRYVSKSTVATFHSIFLKEYVFILTDFM